MATQVEQELEEVSLFDDNDKPIEAVEEVTPEKEKPSFDMPEKFAGKSVEDVVESYLNLEKALGSKANEVGELRKLTDQILLNQASQGQQPAVQEDINEDVSYDYFDDPSAAVEKALKNNPRMQAFEKEIETNAVKTSRDALKLRHDDADSVVASPEFQKWVGESPGRSRMLNDAHIHRDVDVAADLLDMYKTTRKAATENAIEERDAIAKGDFKKAAVEKGSVPVNTKKTYRRAELIQLKIRDPQRYEAMSPEIHKAYAEGRVK
jgi:hypothetical protein